jgi:aryl-alcohol dehydrogenase-like predicted oxidoreductase
MGKLLTMPQPAARRWAAAQRGITCVIIGPRNQDHLQQNLAGLRLDLPAELVDHLTRISQPEGQ